jgi:hypothetical protein
MQKISSYLYPNRINVVADLAAFPVRWNIVYQNRVKIYQGVDNVLTLDVKNADQKRIDISEMDIKMSVTDVNGKQILVADAVPMSTTGLATITITPDALENLIPQFLTYTVYKENLDDTRTVLYADTQFEARGKMELVDTVLAKETAPRYITRFLPITNDSVEPYIVTYFSDAVDVRQPNFLTVAEDDSVSLDFKFLGLSGSVTVQYTYDDVVSSTIEWFDIETFSVASSTSSISKTYDYPVYNRKLAWMRIKYVLDINNTGKIDSVTVRL